MSDDISFSIEDADVDFENSPTKIVFIRNLQELKVADVVIGPSKEGEEYETKNWIASKLVRAGLAHFHEESLMNIVTLNKIHWKETKLQTGRQISSLPNFFYPLIRKYIRLLKEKATSDASVANEYNNALRLIRDIVDCRLKKIVSLSASPIQTEDILRSLSQEERLFFEYLRLTVHKWKSKILKMEAME